jgi:hypothetical protein
MALIKCKECGNEVSSTAKTCPQCGAQVARKPIGCLAGFVVIVLLLIVGQKIVSLFKFDTRPHDARIVKEAIRPPGAGPYKDESTTSRNSPVALGTPADTVLQLRGKAISINQVGRDANGLLVEWEYPDVTYLMGRRAKDGIEAYRVIKITVRK